MIANDNFREREMMCGVGLRAMDVSLVLLDRLMVSVACYRMIRFGHLHDNRNCLR
jgi:hypothetical protein